MLETEYSNDIVVSDDLKENNMLVVEVTQKEALEIEQDKNVLVVEEDILISASDIKKQRQKTKTKNKKD